MPGFYLEGAGQERVTQACLFLMCNSCKKVQHLPHTHPIPSPTDSLHFLRLPTKLKSGVNKGSSFGTAKSKMEFRKAGNNNLAIFKKSHLCVVFWKEASRQGEWWWPYKEPELELRTPNQKSPASQEGPHI